MSIVFVDDLRKPNTVFNVTTFCSNLFTFPTCEKTLVSFARRIGIRKMFLRNRGNPSAYFIVSDDLRIRAIDAGAAECTFEEAIAMMRKVSGK